MAVADCTSASKSECDGPCLTQLFCWRVEVATGMKGVDALLGGICLDLEGGTYLGRAAEVQVVTSEDNETASSLAAVTTHDIESETDAGYAETVQLSSGHIFHITEGGGTYLGRVTGEDTSLLVPFPQLPLVPRTRGCHSVLVTYSVSQRS